MRSTFVPLAFASTSFAQGVPPSPCLVTNYTAIPAAVSNCTSIVLRDIAVPGGSKAIDLTGLQANSVVTFAGKTTFGYTNSSTFEPIVISGKNVTIKGERGSVIDGNGNIYWDGLGSNGGVNKPNKFIVLKKMTAGSVVKDLTVKNWPVHLFGVSSCTDLTITDLVLDNSAGDAPNAASGTLAAAHNSDGFDVSSCTNVTIKNTKVFNQDDCVAVTSGDKITVDNMYCSGGHGLSIGSIGGKSNNNVTNIMFSNSKIINSTNGPRIKSNYNTTGFISNITYSNIHLSNISSYGIVIQQDYLNGGPTGSPSNGVIIENVLVKNVSGTATSKAKNYYVLCGNGSCSNFVWDNVHIVGGGKNSSCNFPASGCPA
ncbi:neutral endopolygalacturonase SSPG6 [Tricladium varicosporioides]|nr:neutral endopolygalacturonase SSPG6 [Hymenoscyphus varicosporioides]